MNYPLYCPYCGKEIDSMDSYADTKQEVRDHIKIVHPDKTIPEEL